METVLGWQVLIALSIIGARALSARAMIVAAVCWTAFTFFAVWSNQLFLLQLGTTWGTAWLATLMFGERGRTNVATAEASRAPEREELPLEVEPNSLELAAIEIPSAPGAAPRTPVESASDVSKSVKNSNKAADWLTGASEDLREYAKRSRENLEANRDLRSQVRMLRSSVDLALEIGVSMKARQETFSSTPGLEAIYRDLGPDSEIRNSLFSVSLMPVERTSLPASAVEQRQQMLKEALEFLGDAHKRVSRDAALLAAVESHVTEPFLPYLTAQETLLREHLDRIATPASPPGSIWTLAARTGRIPALVVVSSTEPGANPNSERGPASPVATSTLERRGIESAARELRIPHLVHFTRCENLPGILRHGLKSVAACETDGLVPMRNDESRFDAQPDGTSLSVTFPNYRMFFKYRKLAPGADWVVLLISSRVIWEKDCAFYRHNAADARMSRQPRDQKKSVQALREMFAADADDRDAWLRPYDPTDPQAEVLVYETIEPSLIEAVAFETAEARARHLKHLAGCESFWTGAGKGLFASRQLIRSRG